MSYAPHLRRYFGLDADRVQELTRSAFLELRSLVDAYLGE